MLSQESGPIQKSLERRFRVFQSLHVGQVSIRLDRVDESVRRLLAPGLEGLRGGQLIESIVDLDRVESPGVELEPLLRRRFFRIEAPAPVIVIPSRTADANRFYLRVCIIGLIGPIANYKSYSLTYEFRRNDKIFRAIGSRQGAVEDVQPARRIIQPGRRG